MADHIADAGNMPPDSAVTAAELDEARKWLGWAERRLDPSLASYIPRALLPTAITPASQEAPASPAADMVLVPRDDLQTLIEQADSMAFERSSQDYEQFGRPQYIENAYGWLLAPASPSPGLREP